MSILKIARLGHPILYKKATLVKNISNPSIKKLITDMTETMLDANGIGLAAPQVHVSKQIIIFRIPNEESEVNDKSIEITVLINPKLSPARCWRSVHRRRALRRCDVFWKRPVPRWKTRNCH